MWGRLLLEEGVSTTVLSPLYLVIGGVVSDERILTKHEVSVDEEVTAFLEPVSLL